MESVLRTLLTENEFLTKLLAVSANAEQFKILLRKYVEEKYFVADNLTTKQQKTSPLEAEWKNYAYRRVILYLNTSEVNCHQTITDVGQQLADPFAELYHFYHHHTTHASIGFWYDLLWLFRQLNGNMQYPRLWEATKQLQMHHQGTEAGVQLERQRNKTRIILKLIELINKGEIVNNNYTFEPCHTEEEKFEMMQQWWNEYMFHLQFAVRTPEALNAMLDHTLDPRIMQILQKARDKGIPFFVNPHYLSLIIIDRKSPYFNADAAIRQYVIYSEELVNEFGHIKAWEKEDLVVAEKPNAAGWILPYNDSIHRRYPDVAILIPATTGRACGGLCSTCQRMYDFQRGNLNFNLQKLAPTVKWKTKLNHLMEYFRYDSALKDILITGGDALMSTDSALGEVLEAVLQMAKNKRNDNQKRANGEKYAEIKRVRLGTRIPVYIPQRITPQLVSLLKNFRDRACEVGIQQFIIQMHVETSMEITPEFVKAVNMLIDSGWTLTNQMVYTAAASRRGHAVKLRHVLSHLGVLPYYTFAVKGFNENKSSYTPLARLVQEEVEEKNCAVLPEKYLESFQWHDAVPQSMAVKVKEVMKESNLPFLATDRNLMNLPGVGKSLTFRTIGITLDGRRVLEFEYDSYRRHSPIIHQGAKVQMVESKSIFDYLQQMTELGENVADYETVWGFTESTTEPVHPVFEYPAYNFMPTTQFTNLDIMSAQKAGHH